MPAYEVRISDLSSDVCSSDLMFTLVGNIEAYPQFLPGCVSARVEHVEWPQVRARLGFRVKGLTDSFATENHLDDNLISMRLLDGPFRQLDGNWHFTPLGDTACKVSLQDRKSTRLNSSH